MRFQMTPVAPQAAEAISIVVEVAAVSEFPQPAGPGLRAPFSIVFHGPLAPVMPQGIYRLEQEEFGVTELFLVPIGPNVPEQAGEPPSAMRYEAVFG